MIVLIAIVDHEKIGVRVLKYNLTLWYIVYNNLFPSFTNKKYTKMSKSVWSFPSAFYVANTMEIFERLAWYGFFTLSSLYMTTPVAQGGVGFTEEQRGALQGIIPFFLYLLPVITGALADRYGYRKMFIISFLIMAPSYYLLGQASSFSSFFIAFSAVAIGAACFKPVVVGTISHCTNDKNRGLGFGIFYTMVNIGGFIGPLVAGYVRAISWDAVFMMSALWILINLLPAVFFYRSPTSQSKASGSFAKTLKQAQQILGNARFALLIFPCIVLLMLAGSSFISYGQAVAFVATWLVINAIWEKLFVNQSTLWYRQPVKVSNTPFALYLVILTGFWTIYMQLFYTMPLYIRDFVDTTDLVNAIAPLGEGLVSFLAFVNKEALVEHIQQLAASGTSASVAFDELIHLKVRVPIAEIQQGLLLLGTQPDPQAVSTLADKWISQYRQINPEYIINLDFLAIVICQIAVSYVCQKFKEINVLFAGVIVFSLGCVVAILADSAPVGGAVVVLAVLMMAFGEMITSPKSQEYVASIAPKSQSALYMGYYFVSMALGFLFAGLISGWAYGELAKSMNRPELMWALFAIVGVVTSIGLIWFNRRYVQSNAFEIKGAVSDTGS